MILVQNRFTITKKKKLAILNWNILLIALLTLLSVFTSKSQGTPRFLSLQQLIKQLNRSNKVRKQKNNKKRGQYCQSFSINNVTPTRCTTFELDYMLMESQFFLNIIKMQPLKFTDIFQNSHLNINAHPFINDK